jgi:hypothetical protein
VQSAIGPSGNLLPAAARTAAAAAFSRLVTIPAIDRSVATRFKWHCCRLAATRTNHRCTLCRSRTVAGPPLVVLLCLTASLATLWGRITTFLKERLISSGEGEVLPAIAARKLNISGHGSPRGNCTAQYAFVCKYSFEIKKLVPESGFLVYRDCCWTGYWRTCWCHEWALNWGDWGDKRPWLLRGRSISMKFPLTISRSKKDRTFIEHLQYTVVWWGIPMLLLELVGIPWREWSLCC